MTPTDLELPSNYTNLPFEPSAGELIPVEGVERLYRVFTFTPPHRLGDASERGLTIAIFPPPTVAEPDAYNNLQINLSNLRAGRCALTPGGTASWTPLRVSAQGMRGIAFDIPSTFFGQLIPDDEERRDCEFSASDFHLVSFSLSTPGVFWLAELSAVAVASGRNTLPEVDDK